MKTIGLLGGMTYESTAEYYRAINRHIQHRLGGEHSAKLILQSVDFEEIAVLMAHGDWPGVGALLGQAAANLERAGAELLLLCSNTAHKVAGAIEAQLRIPLINIMDTTAQAIRTQGFNRVGLLGTAFTMQDDFYRSHLERHWGLKTLTPCPASQTRLHRIIAQELSIGTLTRESRSACLEIIEALAREGAEGVILGCTEIPLLIRQQDTEVPLFDSMALHAQAAVDYALTATY